MGYLVVFRLQNSNSFMDDLHRAAGLEVNYVLILQFQKNQEECSALQLKHHQYSKFLSFKRDSDLIIRGLFWK